MNWSEFAKANGGKFVATPDGSEVVMDWGHPVAEYRAAREVAVILRRDDLGVLELSGGDRAKFLHNFCTNDIKKLAVGASCEAFACNVKGRIIAHLLVVAEAERLLVFVDRARVEFLQQHLDRYLITEDVTIANVTEQLDLLEVCGPSAATAVRSSSCASFSVENWDAGQGVCFLMTIAPEELVETIERLRLSGAALAGATVREVLRIEARFPKYGVDISDEHLAQEANRTATAISFTKGCYLGQEPIARLDALGHVNRILSLVHYPSTSAVAAGTELVDPNDGSPVGRVSSSVSVPGESRGAALAMIRAKLAAAGTELRLVTADGTAVLGRVAEPGVK